MFMESQLSPPRVPNGASSLAEQAEQQLRGGGTQECPANSCCVMPFRVSCQTKACFFKVTQKTLDAVCYDVKRQVFLHYHMQRMQTADVITFAVACKRLNNQALVPRRTTELNPRPPGQECSPSSCFSH